MEKPEYPLNTPKPYEFHLVYKYDQDKTSKNPPDQDSIHTTDLNNTNIDCLVITGCKESCEEVLLEDRMIHYDDYFCRECGDEGCEECEDQIKSLNGINGKSLQDLLNYLPDGISPKDVKITFEIRDQAGQIFAEGKLIYNKKLDKNEQIAKYKAAVAKYKKRWNKYIKKKLAYDEWKRKEDIAETERKLAELKAGC